MQEKNMSDEEAQEPKERNWRLIFLGFAVIVVVLWCWVGFAPQRVTPSQEKAGQYGDMFGMVNSLFAGLAFAGLIVTMWMQKEELSLQRREFKLQRQVTDGTRKEIERQADFSEKTNLLTRLNMINEGFMLISSTDIDQASFEILRLEYVERLYLSGVINIKDGIYIDNLWNHPRDNALLKIYSLKRYIRESIRWIRTGKGRELDAFSFISKMEKDIDGFIQEPSINRWFPQVSNFKSMLNEALKRISVEPAVFYYLIDSNCPEFISLLDDILRSSRILDLRSIVENSKEFSSFSEIPKAS